jgi:hypothetical protein
VCFLLNKLIYLFIFTRFNLCTYMFMHCIELPHASHILIFGKHTQASKLGGGLSIYPIVARVQHRGEYSTSSNVSIWQI